MDTTTPIYLDHNATTPLDPRVLEAMLPYFREAFANAASRQHEPGRRAMRAVEAAREQAAALIGAQPRDLIWTSGATESNNLAIKGLAHWHADGHDRGRGRAPGSSRHIVTSSIEHKSVLAACQRLEEQGFEVTYVDPTPEGLITADRIAEHLREDTLLVSVMWANNEIGTINPIEPIGALCRQRGVFFHTDATQLIGKLSADVQTAGADLLSFSAHKIYGPKGIAALYARRRNPRVRLQPLIDGGGQERGLRGGTLNVPGIVGFGAACELCRREMADDARRLSALRDTLEARLADRLDPIAVNGCRRSRLPHTTNVSFLGVEAEQLIAAVPQVALSSGSACTTTAIQSSYVLRRMGLGEDRARSSIRFGLGRSTTADQIDRAVEHIVRGVTEGAARSAASCRGAL